MLRKISVNRTAIIGFSLLYVAFCISYIDRAAMSLALTHVGQEFGLKPDELGAVLSIFFLGYAIMQIPGGWLADRFGSKYVVIATIAAWSVFTILTSQAWSLASLLVIRFIFGLAEGGFPSASVKGVAELVEKDSRPKFSALLTSSNYLGSMLAPLIMAPLIIAFGWRHAFEIVGVAGIVFAVGYFFAVPYRRPAPRVAESGGRPRTPVRDLMKNPLIWQLLVVWFGLSCVNKGLDSWMPTYLLQQRGLDLKSVGLLTPVPFLMATIATAIGGWVMTRFFPQREKYLLIGSAVLTGIFLYAMYRSETIAGVIFFQSLVYFFKSFVLATVIALPTKVLADDQIGTGVGIVNTGGQSAGSVAPYVMGVLVASLGTYDAAFNFLLVMTAVSVVAAATIRTRTPAPSLRPAG
ncbi:MFS transporter [Inquilinus limosus]|uniref:MFS transporter n=1 Tax=Inquilinus limosus TaxID=171674 RepID=UPI003F5CDD6D